MSKINIEDETIYTGDAWKSADELKEDIKGKIEVGNFDITDEALALKDVTTTLQKYTKIELKLPNDFLDLNRTVAEQNGTSFEEHIRGLLSGTIEGGTPSEEEEEEEEKEEEEEEPEEEKEEAKPDWDSEEEGEEEAVEPKQIVKVRCHSCKRPITITSPERPITVTCPNCGAKGRLEQ